MKQIQILLSAILFSFTSLFANENILFDISAVELNTKTGIIYGTLLLPNNISNKVPVVILISGSGPTDRDGNNPVMKNNSLKQLAEALANNGIASVRYDKRGIGESVKAAKSESELRFEDYISDAIDWISFVKQNPKFSKVIIIGHSEGSLIGMNAAKYANGFVSISGAGSSADIILKEQLAQKGKVVQDLCYPIIDSLKAGVMIKDVNPMLNSLFRLSVQPYMISWFKHDPQIDIKQLKYPCLILQGDNDLQVSINDAKLLSAAGNESRLLIVEKMNHVLKIIDKGDQSANIASYSNIAMPISAVLTDEIIKYIKN
jgi:pimeloyl-ACP methyl ester carboxylesterase